MGKQSIRYQQLLEELEASHDQEKEDKAEIESIKQSLNQLNNDKTKLVQQRDELSAVKDKHRESLNNARVRKQNQPC